MMIYKRLEQKFGFGKYKGLTFKEVYQGTNDLDKELIIAFLRYKLNQDAEIIMLNEPFIRIDKIQITDSHIKIELYNEDLIGDWSKSIENIFSEGGKFINNFLRGNSTLDEFYTKNWRLVNNKSLVGGNPEYINWCIKKPEGMWFYEKDLTELMALDVYRFQGIKVNYIGNNKYEYSPCIATTKYSFPVATLELNRSRSYAKNDDESGEDNRDYEQQKRNYYRSENDRDNFDAMTDGHIGSYDDWNS